MRWSHLIRHGLLTSSVLGAADAGAKPCGDATDAVVGVTLGLDFAPKVAPLVGLEGRACLSDNTEGMLRVEYGGAGLRLILGARTRPFEKKDVESWGDAVGAEGGLAVELLSEPGQVGAHLALTFGSELKYFAVQGVLAFEEDRRNRVSALFGISPMILGTGDTVGRPVPGRRLDGTARAIVPDVLAMARARSNEDRLVRDHFVRSAQLEYSSVWTFLRLAAELAAVCAPHELVARALDAADDEVRHAEMCAHAAGGLALATMSMAFAQPRFTRRSTQALRVLATEAWREGCLNEGAAAEEARFASENAQGPARSMLATIAVDEAGHARLAWDVLAWVQLVAPEVARAAISNPEMLAAGRSVDDAALGKRGVPSSEVRRAAWARAVANASERVRTVTDA